MAAQIMRIAIALAMLAGLTGCTAFEKPEGFDFLESKSVFTTKPNALNAFDSKSFWCSGTACDPSTGDVASDVSGDAGEGTAH